MFTLTLTPNRSSNARRYASLVIYRRVGDRVDPYRAYEENGRVSVNRMRWRDLRDSEVDAEFEATWLAHVDEQARLAYVVDEHVRLDAL